MPNFHIAMSIEKDFDDIERRAAQGQGPRHALPVLTRRLGAKLYQAKRDAGPVSLVDRIRSKLIGTPECWSFARDLAARLGRGDVIYCFEEIVGVPVAAALRRSIDRPKLVLNFVNLDRPRGRLAAKLFRIADTVDLFCTCSSRQFRLSSGSTQGLGRPALFSSRARRQSLLYSRPSIAREEAPGDRLRRPRAPRLPDPRRRDP